MALAQVIWGASLLSIVAAVLVAVGNNAYITARGMTQRAELEVALEAGIARGILGLLDDRPDFRWRVDGIEQKIRFNSTDISVAIQDELGRFDLNHMGESTLVRLLQSANLESSAAIQLADKILDWREPTSTKRPHGAKDHDYEAAGLIQRPRNGPFQSIDELLLVMDMTDRIFQRIRPALTVNSGHQFIDPSIASPEALMALPAMESGRIRAIMLNRENQDTAKTQSAFWGGRSFMITSTLHTSTNQSTNAICVVRLTDNLSEPYWLLLQKR